MTRHWRDGASEGRETHADRFDFQYDLTQQLEGGGRFGIVLTAEEREQIRNTTRQLQTWKQAARMRLVDFPSRAYDAGFPADVSA